MIGQEKSRAAADLELQQVMMTLAGLASTAQNQLPGESVAQQTERIQAGIIAQLAMPELATAGQWTLKWVEQSADGGNMAYIAQNSAQNAFAVVFRGTVNIINLLQDDDVWLLVPFAGNLLYGMVSNGSNSAFNEIVNKTTLVSTLRGFVQGSSGTPTVYVVGHSLGGAMATMFSLYLRDQLKDDNCTLQCYTFAAPTAGNFLFADWFNKQTPAPVCVWNAYDVVPHAWAALETVKDTFYPSPLPPASANLKQQLQSAINKANGLGTQSQYTQVTQLPPLNADFTTYFSDSRRIPRNDEAASDAYWMDEMAFQHSANNYLGLLGLPPEKLLANPPTVTGVSPSNGKSGDTVTITGKYFTKGCTVRFYLGKQFAAVSESTVVVNSDTSITCQVPAGVFQNDVVVINFAGASGVVNADRFQYDA